MANGIFSPHWERGNIVPVQKKDDKQRSKNYRPISLLPICRKIVERLIFNKMFGFLFENGLLSQHQSSFNPRNSGINQLLSVTHKINQSFDESFDVRRVFLDLFKAFDKVLARWYYFQTETEWRIW